ncbi:MAG: hypothetical protein ABIH74_00640, partial [Candidatus Omnitrophota bacterium]
MRTPPSPPDGSCSILRDFFTGTDQAQFQDDYDSGGALIQTTEYDSAGNIVEITTPDEPIIITEHGQTPFMAAGLFGITAAKFPGAAKLSGFGKTLIQQMMLLLTAVATFARNVFRKRHASDSESRVQELSAAYSDIETDKKETAEPEAREPEELVSIFRKMEGILTEAQRAAFSAQYVDVLNRFSGMDQINEYHGFSHTVHDISIVAQGVSRMREQGRPVDLKDAFKTLLAALYHDVAYSGKDVFTHDHVEKSVDQAGAILENLSESQPVLGLTLGEIDDILVMIASTSITPLPFESQKRVKELREKGIPESNPSLIRMRNILLAADLVGAATTPEYLSELAPLYREFAASVKSDMFGSALQLMAGTNGFQNFFAKGMVLKNLMQDGEEVDDFLKDIFTAEQQVQFNKHMKTAEIIREIYDGLKEGKTVDETEADNPIARLKKRKTLFVGPNMSVKEKRDDFNNTVFMLRMMNRMVKGEHLTRYMAQRLRDLRKDPAFECDASIVLLHVLTQDAENLTDRQIKIRLPKIRALLARIGELRARKKTNGEITYGFDRFYDPAVLISTLPEEHQVSARSYLIESVDEVDQAEVQAGRPADDAVAETEEERPADDAVEEAAAKFKVINESVSDLMLQEEEITARMEKIEEEYSTHLQKAIDRIAREVTKENALKGILEATDEEADGALSEQDERIINAFGVAPETYVEMRKFYDRDEIEARLRILKSCAHDEITLKTVANAELIKAGQEARKIQDIIKMSAEVEAVKRTLAELKRKNAEEMAKRLSSEDRFYFAVVREYDGWLAAERKTDSEPALEEKVTRLFKSIAGALANAADIEYGLGGVEALTGRRIEVLKDFALRAILAAEKETARSEQFIEAAKEQIDEELERFFVPGKGERESKAAAEVKTRMKAYLGGEKTPFVRDFIILTLFEENAQEGHTAFSLVREEVTDISEKMGEVLVNLTFLEFQTEYLEYKRISDISRASKRNVRRIIQEAGIERSKMEAQYTALRKRLIKTLVASGAFPEQKTAEAAVAKTDAHAGGMRNKWLMVALMGVLMAVVIPGVSADGLDSVIGDGTGGVFRQDGEPEDQAEQDAVLPEESIVIQVEDREAGQDAVRSQSTPIHNLWDGYLRAHVPELQDEGADPGYIAEDPLMCLTWRKTTVPVLLELTVTKMLDAVTEDGSPRYIFLGSRNREIQWQSSEGLIGMIRNGDVKEVKDTRENRTYSVERPKFVWMDKSDDRSMLNEISDDGDLIPVAVWQFYNKTDYLSNRALGSRENGYDGW